MNSNSFLAPKPPTSLHTGGVDSVKLCALRTLIERIAKLAAALLGAADADVLVENGGRIWRTSGAPGHGEDPLALELARSGDGLVWIADTLKDGRWVQSSPRRGAGRVRFCAVAPISMKSGALVGALRVFDAKPREFDRNLGERLIDLAAIIEDEWERLNCYDLRCLRELFDKTPGFMAILAGPDYIFEVANAAYAELIGARNLQGRSAKEVIPEGPAEGFFDLLDGVMTSGEAYVAYGAPMKFEVSPGLQQTKYVDLVYQPVFNLTGEVSSVFISGHDVTEERKSTEALRKGQLELERAQAATQAIFDHSHDVICIIDADGLFRQVGSHSAKTWGYPPEEIIGRPYLDFILPDDHQASLDMVRQAREGRPTSSFRNRFVHRDGSIVPIMWSAAWSPRHDALFAIARDMRESELAETRLRRGEKMEAIERLTGGVAHDFNNILAIIIGGAEGLTELLPAGTEGHELARVTLEAGERGAALVDQLLSFSKEQSLHPRPLDANVLLSAFEALVRPTLREDIALTVRAPQEIWCEADPTQLKAALLHLTANAQDAMPEGGVLTVTAEKVSLSALALAHTKVAPGTYLRFRVEDTGCGMDGSIVARATDPFFTTKGVGEGTGLGLAMAYGFCKQSRGGLLITSQVGVGTRVDLYLPEARPLAAVAPRVWGEPAQAPAATILVVEDQALVRANLVRMLHKLGFKVIETENPTEALNLLHDNLDVDLLLTDVVMPGMNGLQLAKHARSVRPGLKVLLTSGHADQAIGDGGIYPAAEQDLLRKPYRRAELARRLDLALKSKSEFA